MIAISLVVAGPDHTTCAGAGAVHPMASSEDGECEPFHDLILVASMREDGEPGKGVEAADPPALPRAHASVASMVVATHRIRLTYCVP